MTTFVERLRTASYVMFSDGWASNTVAREAANEIERLGKKLFAEQDRSYDLKILCDEMAKEIERLRVSLRQKFCPRPCNGRPDQFDVGDCVDAGECGCGSEIAAYRKEKEVGNG